MLSTFDVNPRWSREAEAEAAAGKQEQQHSSNDGTRPDTNTTMPHRMDAHGINTTGGGGNPPEDMIDVPGAHSTPSPTNAATTTKRTSSASFQKAQRRGSWCIDMPVMEGDHAGGVSGGISSHHPPPSPPGRTEVSDPESSGSQLEAGSSDHAGSSSGSMRSSAGSQSHSASAAVAAAAVGGVAASSMSDIYERARKNLFGSGGGLDGGSSSSHGGSRRSSSGSGGDDAWDLSTGPTSGGAGGDIKFSASHGSSTSHQPSLTTATPSSAALPAWMKDKLRKDRLRREESSRSRLSNTSTSGSTSSSSGSRGPAPPTTSRPPVRAVSTEELYRKADDGRRSSSFRRQPRSSSYNVPLRDDSDDDVDDVFPNDHHHHEHPQHVDYTMPLSASSRSNSTEDLVSRRMSNEQLVRKERRSKSAWGRNHSGGKAAKRRASEGDIADDDADTDDHYHSDGDVSSKSFADRLEDLYDELDDDKGVQIRTHPRRDSSSDIHPTGDYPNGSAKSLDCDLEAAIVRRSREAGELGHSGRFAAPRAPTRRGSNRNLQDIDFDLDDDLNDASGDLSGDFGGDRPPRYDPSMVSSSPNDEGSSSANVNNHNSASSGSSNRRDNNRSQRSFRIMFNTHGESHLEPTKNQFGDTFGDFDFNPLDYKDYTSNIVHIRRQRRINWCRVATVVMAACAIVLSAMTAYQKLGLPWSSNSSPPSSTTEPSNGAVIGLDDASSTRADWATDWDFLSSVKLPAHIESNLADWTSFAPAVEGQRRDQNYKVQRMNDEIPPEDEDEEEENQSTPTPLLWTIPFSGSTVTEEVFGQCLHLVQTSDLGVFNGHDSDDSLSVQQIRGHSYVNVDTTTEAGIQHANELDLVKSGISDVISTPLLHDVVRDLFDASHQGRAFVVLRNPIDRAMATYHYLTTGRFHGPDGETLDQLSSKTLLEYAESEFCDDNWLTRTLVNKPQGKLGQKDLNLAKGILRRKAIIGLYSDLATSLQHFVGVFGWDAPSSWNGCAADLIDRAYAREQDGFPRLGTDEPAYAQIQKKNKFDLELYDFAVQLRYQQMNTSRNA